jgi:hypothetical protein
MVRPENVDDFEMFHTDGLEVFIQKDLMSDSIRELEFLIQNKGSFTVRFLSKEDEGNSK